MFDSYGGDSAADGGPGFTVSWNGGEADYEPQRFDREQPWALHETPVSGNRDGHETPDPPPDRVLWAREFVPVVLAELTPRQRFVIELYWDVGVRAHRPYTFDEIAQFMGTTKQAVHQLHCRAMKTLRSRWAT